MYAMIKLSYKVVWYYKATHGYFYEMEWDVAFKLVVVTGSMQLLWVYVGLTGRLPYTPIKAMNIP